MATTQLTQTPTNTNSRQKFTISFWLKRSKLSSEQCVWTTRLDSGNNTLFKFNANDTFTFKCNKSNADALVLTSNALFRDVSGWYNVVIAVDTTQSTDTNRVKIYINGVQETSFGTATYPSQNLSLEINESGNQVWYIGSESSQNYFDGSISYFAFVSETQEVPGIFGETDSTTGEWEIKATITPSVAWGTNGFLILKNGNSLTDESSNSNNFTLGGGTLTKTEDCPSNVFCTWNAANPFGGTLTNGNLTVGNSSSFNHNVQGSLGMEKGKFYWEYKMTNTHGQFGVCENSKAGQADPQGNIGFYFLYNNGNTTGTVFNNVSGSSSSTITVSAFANGMILGCAYDADNEALYIHQNGTYVTSGDPTSGASKTGAIITNLRARYGGTIVPLLAFGTSGTRTNFDVNFGNGFFGTTAVSSAGTNASGNGIFEYDVPTGYTALSTKGLNE